MALVLVTTKNPITDNQQKETKKKFSKMNMRHGKVLKKLRKVWPKQVAYIKKKNEANPVCVTCVWPTQVAYKKKNEANQVCVKAHGRLGVWVHE